MLIELATFLVFAVSKHAMASTTITTVDVGGSMNFLIANADENAVTVANGNIVAEFLATPGYPDVASSLNRNAIETVSLCLFIYSVFVFLPQFATCRRPVHVVLRVLKTNPGPPKISI